MISYAQNAEDASVQAIEEELSRLRDRIASLEGELTRRGRHALLSAEPAEAVSPSGFHGNQRSQGAELPEREPARGLRVAVCSSAWEAAGRLAGRLAEKTGVSHLTVEHPGDLDFDDLPDEFVLELDRAPSALLGRLFGEHRIDVVAVAEAADGAAGRSDLPTGSRWAARTGSVVVSEGEVADDLDAVVLRVLADLEAELAQGPAARTEPHRLRLLNGEGTDASGATPGTAVRATPGPTGPGLI